MNFAPGLRPLAALALVLALAACNGDEAHKPFTIAVTTPNGEPLPTPPLQGFDSPGCPGILGPWFDRIDANHDGVVDRAEFMADAEAQFARMDLNHDGIVTPGTLAQYRAGFQGHEAPKPFKPGYSGGYGGGGGSGPVLVADAGGIPSAATSGKRGKSLTELVQGGGYDPRVEPDLVMSADTSLRFQVTRKDFMDQAARRFAALDMSRDGHITKQEAMLWCLKRVRWPDQPQ